MYLFEPLGNSMNTMIMIKLKMEIGTWIMKENLQLNLSFRIPPMTPPEAIPMA